MEYLCKPTKVGRNMVHIHQIRVGPNWMDSIVLFLKEDILPESKSKTRQGTEKGSSILVV